MKLKQSRPDIYLIGRIDLKSEVRSEEKSDSEVENTKSSGKAPLGFFEQLKLRWLEDKEKNSNSDSSSCFSASSEDQNPFEQTPHTQPLEAFLPVYRKEHGGIVIYDVDAIMPDQPMPDQDIQIDVSWLHKSISYPWLYRKWSLGQSPWKRPSLVIQINPLRVCQAYTSWGKKLLTGRYLTALIVAEETVELLNEILKAQRGLKQHWIYL